MAGDILENTLNSDLPRIAEISMSTSKTSCLLEIQFNFKPEVDYKWLVYKVAQSDGFEFLSCFWDKYIRLISIMYCRGCDENGKYCAKSGNRSHISGIPGQCANPLHHIRCYLYTHAYLSMQLLAWEVSADYYSILRQFEVTFILNGKVTRYLKCKHAKLVLASMPKLWHHR